MEMKKDNIPDRCIGEKCRMCGHQAMHKVGEELFQDERHPYRHNLTAYVCCECFAAIFGPAAKIICRELRH